MPRVTEILYLSAFFYILINCNNYLPAQDKFKPVKIGGQEWMADNLDIEKFRNGELIPQARTAEEWKKAGEEGKPVWSSCSNNTGNGKKYGKLYNWYAVNDKRLLAPKGWHIPSKTEFETLVIEINDSANELKALGEGKADGAGNNKRGFSALLAGCRDRNGSFIYLGECAFFWSSTENDRTSACFLGLDEGLDYTNVNDNYSMCYGFSVRCIKD